MRMATTNADPKLMLLPETDDGTHYTVQDFLDELQEAMEEIRSFSIDPLVYAALIATHDDPRGFLGKEE